MVEKLARDTPRDTVLAFTDGPCLSNPGPGGAGAAIFPPDMDTVQLRMPFAVYGSIILAELVAIRVVLQNVITKFRMDHINILECFVTASQQLAS